MTRHVLRYETPAGIRAAAFAARPRLPYLRLGTGTAVHAATGGYIRSFEDGTTVVDVITTCGRHVDVARPGLVGLTEAELPPLDSDAGESRPDLWPYCSRCFGLRSITVEWREQVSA